MLSLNSQRFFRFFHPLAQCNCTKRCYAESNSIVGKENSYKWQVLVSCADSKSCEFDLHLFSEEIFYRITYKSDKFLKIVHKLKVVILLLKCWLFMVFEIPMLMECWISTTVDIGNAEYLLPTTFQAFWHDLSIIIQKYYQPYYLPISKTFF